MNKKRLSVISLCLVAIITVVAVIAFQAGVYYRDATLNLDVGTSSLHVTVYVQRVGEENMYWDHHAGVLTTIGLNYIEGKLGDNAFANNTAFAEHIAVSSDTGSPAAGWLKIPSEITTGGLDRNTGTYASTGDGVWTISYQFTASATHTDVQLTGLCWASTDGGNGDLLGADTFTAVTLNSGDKLTVTWTAQVS